MNMQNTKQQRLRSQAVSSALGSVRAEGLQPSRETQARLKRYANGEITAHQLRRETLQEVRSRHN